MSGYKPTPLMLPTSRYDKRRADFAVGFIQMLKHTTGEWHGKQFSLMPWQEQIVRDIFSIVARKRATGSSAPHTYTSPRKTANQSWQPQ